ncbi:MAG: biotin--[acetyl-CoA-carboxylase] ligase [Candidatus Izemoplasmatales bacterium]|jgi:BirA family biotin operon repressor/biotin-[acetyl-CoA-carboxylase] ligase|nr:biotin--[acetyl-CoA-carboxylase] ligase [Candidatus Izemoplasmatales bacterium]
MKKIHFDTIISTNAFLKNHYHELADFFLVSTTHQTEGRGRLGRIWNDDRNSALFSILIKQEVPVNLIDRIPLIAVTSVHKVLSRLVPRILIKWPNDIIMTEKKLAGILVESVFAGDVLQSIVVGFGINVNNRTFSTELLQKSTSLAIETDRFYDIDALIDEIAKSFQTEFQAWRDGNDDFIKYCNRFSSLFGRTITFYHDNQEFKGKAGLMAIDGSLAVSTPEGNIYIHSGEVSLSDNRELPLKPEK